MFSKGQIVFGVLFFVVFAVIVAYQYRKDINIHKRFYKGSFWVLLAFIAFIGLISAIKFLL
ncbi:membrane protein [Tamlana sedimentorum]|uniref:Membrane protein n=1 Tax=Neotamlana sedimentorum TaxID=1435349 RepID=A0A0D7W9C0_9FLAO|nr:membrane protein [Tamlana sedimentorum]